MKKFIKPLLFLVLIGLAISIFAPRKEKTKKSAKIPLAQKSFVVIIPSYNNAAYCAQNLLSVFSQDYPNFRIIYIDDASKDATYEVAKSLIEASPLRERVTLIHNETNQGALKNIYTAVHSCKNEEIIVTVDGDDFFAHSGVLSRLNKAYSNPSIWMTYGNYLDYPTYKQDPLICKPFPSKVIRNNTFRASPWVSSHLRTFYAGLFKKIPVSDFLFEGVFLPMGWDLAFMLPMLEMSGVHCLFIDEVLYLYNRSNPINDHKKNLKLQASCAEHVRRLPAYSPLQTPPYE